VLSRYLGNVPLASALADVVVTSYDMAYGEPVLFSSRPREDFVTDVPMIVIVAARATSAGPTFFKPQALSDGDRERVLVDGGVYVNNPSILGYLLGGRAAAGRPLLLVTLGTRTPPTRGPGSRTATRSGTGACRPPSATAASRWTTRHRRTSPASAPVPGSS
jgi:predicted acylesterase/phospholipase RssA